MNIVLLSLPTMNQCFFSSHGLITKTHINCILNDGRKWCHPLSILYPLQYCKCECEYIQSIVKCVQWYLSFPNCSLNNWFLKLLSNKSLRIFTAHNRLPLTSTSHNKNEKKGTKQVLHIDYWDIMKYFITYLTYLWPLWPP